MSTFRELKAVLATAIDNNLDKPVVKFTDRIEDCESYLDSGMKARVGKIVWKESFAEVDGGDMYEITFDVSDFLDYNANYERNNWYDKAGIPCLTATEAGEGPKNGIVEVFLMELPDKYGDYFEIVEDDGTKLFRLDEEEMVTLIKALGLLKLETETFYEDTREIEVIEGLHKKLNS